VSVGVGVQVRGVGRICAPPGSPYGGAAGHASNSSESGYLLVDATVALLILALALAFGLRAAGQARTAVEQASEVDRAHALIAQLLETGPRTFDVASGHADAFDWTVETRSVGAAQPIALCHRRVRLANPATHRTFSAATLETCPIEPAA
jgi:hypothetical protein